jgi:hypothetical protein
MDPYGRARCAAPSPHYFQFQNLHGLRLEDSRKLRAALEDSPALMGDHFVC